MQSWHSNPLELKHGLERQLLEDEIRNAAEGLIGRALRNTLTGYAEFEQITKRSFAAKGLSRSGALVKALVGLATERFEVGLQEAWQSVQNLLESTGVSYYDGLADELLELLEKNFHRKRLLDTVEASLPKDIYKKAQLDQQLSSSYEQPFLRIKQDIDVFLLCLKRKPKLESNSAMTQINIYNSKVGAVQTGDNSTAIVSQAEQNQTFADLRNVLTQIECHIQSAAELPPEFQREEVLEVVREALQETERQIPNKTRIKGLLSGLGAVLATTKQLKDAYELLRPIAELVGVALPPLS